MINNTKLGKAKAAKNDEFYTQYEYIEKEMQAYLEYNPDAFHDKIIFLPCDDPSKSNFTRYFAQNFQRFGLKELISTSYAPESKRVKCGIMNDLFNPNIKTMPKEEKLHGKIFVLNRDKNGDGKIDINDLEGVLLKGDGDFRSDEVKAIRDKSDMIITNPPFSLFREFIAWIMEAGKKFSVIGNMNAITYKDVFHLIKENKIWIGATNFNVGMYFLVPNGFHYASTYKFAREKDGHPVNRVPGVCWFTNIEHGRRHSPMRLMTMADNIKFSHHKEVKNKIYKKYDNYNALEVPYADAMPSDYKGIMGIPISFMNRYCPEQFEILGMSASAGYDKDIVGIPFEGEKDARPLIDGKNKYARIFLRFK
jgi:hypothetical protein